MGGVGSRRSVGSGDMVGTDHMINGIVGIFRILPILGIAEASYAPSAGVDGRGFRAKSAAGDVDVTAQVTEGVFSAHVQPVNGVVGKRRRLEVGGTLAGVELGSAFSAIIAGALAVSLNIGQPRGVDGDGKCLELASIPL